MTGYEIDVFREGAEEDVELSEFSDEIEAWIIEEFAKIGMKSYVLELSLNYTEKFPRYNKTNLIEFKRDIYYLFQIIISKLSRKKNIIEMVGYDQIQKYIDLGAGEILINNVSKEGTLSGFDFSLLELLNKRLNIPIILNGGINSYKEINLILENENIDAVGVGAFFIYYGPHRAVLISYMPDDERK